MPWGKAVLIVPIGTDLLRQASQFYEVEEILIMREFIEDVREITLELIKVVTAFVIVFFVAIATACGAVFCLRASGVLQIL